MALQTANQFQLTPDIGGAVSRGINTGLGIKQAQRQTQLSNQQATEFEQGQQKLVLQGAANAAVKLQNLPTNEDKIAFLQKRIPELKDPSDSQEVLDLFNSGQPEKANALLDSFVKTSVRTGLIQAPIVAKTVSKQQATGGLVFDPTTGKYSVDEVARKRFDVLAKKKEAGNLGIKEKQSINKDISGFIKNAVDIKTTANDLVRLKDLGTGASSIAAIFKFMKANDPTSTVREGEFATAENSGGIPAAVVNFYNKKITGERIAPKEVQQFVDVAKTLSNSAIESSSRVVKDFLGTFGSDLGAKFPIDIMQRIPEPFELGEPSQKNIVVDF